MDGCYRVEEEKEKENLRRLFAPVGGTDGSVCWVSMSSPMVGKKKRYPNQNANANAPPNPAWSQKLEA
jgi:hypothetical protein